jgi:hypothetical protein
MKQKTAWEITDGFWEKVKDLPVRNSRNEEKEYKRTLGGGRKPKDFRIGTSGGILCTEDGYGPSSAVHRYFQLGSDGRVFYRCGGGDCGGTMS